jgi:cytochrome c oxidase subunit 3
MKNININRSQFQAFPYHLVDPSPWPILVSFSLLTLTIGAVMYMHGFANGGSLLNLGFVLTASGMALWFRDVISEGTLLGHHTKEVKSGLIIGVVLFIVSEVFAFLSVFWAFFHSSLSPAIEIGGSWPPLGITPLDPFAIPLLNTFLLLSSGAFVTYGHHALIAGNRKGAIIGTFLTIVFAIIFTALQYFEYSEAAFSMSDGVYGSAFYASTGLHGLHVIVGTIFILVGFIRLINYHLTDTHHQGHEAGILYWHFVDVVWLFLFMAVYFWGGA